MKNKITRREALIAGAAMFPAFSLLARPPIKKYHIGVQLYSVREEMKKDPLATLKKISEIGYREVEPASYVNQQIYGYSAFEFRKILDDLGLSMPTSHTGFKKAHWDITRNDITDEYKKTLEDAVVTGQKLMIVPSFDWDKKNIDEVKKGIEAFNRMGEIASQSGLLIGFHNHHQEFEERIGEGYLYDFMLKEWDPRYVVQQLDIANMSVAGVDPMAFLRKYPKHYESIHVKDFDPKTKRSTHLGEGSLKMDEILTFAKKNTSIQYWVIEQEDYGTKTPLEAVDFDLHRFKKYGFI
ncbi:sugar phosphate isomerase/epimerase family protein [Dyadobacter sp. 32]|uniref:sugar phosphate isomerase/epimerase family protein n=1 Tax=Dyadobacter sp. 32 TaxID=538966 RepID=UPI0011ECBC03